MHLTNAHFPVRAEGFWDGYRDPMAGRHWLARWALGWFIGRQVRLFELTRPFRYVMTDGDVITAPAGYRTDGASIPRRLQDIFPPFGAWVEAAIIHDYLCTRGLEGRSVAVSPTLAHDRAGSPHATLTRSGKKCSPKSPPPTSSPPGSARA
jgi:hypothetical protein